MPVSAFDVMLLTLASGGFLLGLVSCAFHWVKRAQHPATADIEARLAAMRSELTDWSDRVEHWMRRDRVRKSRDAAEARQDAPDDAPSSAAAIASPGSQFNPKDELRRVARARGVIR